MFGGTVLVLDPIGAPVHGELPATWRDLGERRKVVWCGRGADGFWGEARAALDQLTGPVDIVAAGASVPAAMTLGREHANTVRSVLLVDPAAAERTVSAAEARAADAVWQQHEASRIRAMAEEGVRVRVIAHSWAGDGDRRDAPLPLGHPAVVERVKAEISHESPSMRGVLDMPAKMTVLDQPASLLQTVIGKILPSRKLRDLLHGTWLGHPVHPALAQFPIGMYMSATVLDFMPGRHKHAPGVLIGLGVLASVPTAAAGAADYTHATPEQRRTGLVHALVNSAGLLCYISSLWARLRGHRMSGKGEALLGLTLVSAGAMLGGHLSFRHAMGTNHAQDVPYVSPTEWSDLGPADHYPQRQPTRRLVGDVPVVVVRDGDDFYVLADKCSHAGGPLSDGTLRNDGELCIECPWHGSTFGLMDGAVVHGPATAPQPVFDTRVEQGHLQAQARTWG
ncbi:Rieske 2Fe-2S domain-containing protein [Actinocrispum sp. NPDC049592]|uniref:Rieske 2Fe-2S domain-containing protein n=1 Tax=Actinocrispum sp. NPDC049592 TaxID=3154835 RepID=UPI003425883E